MEEVAGLLNDLLAAGIISNYAVFGAIAQMRYTEPVATLDADILIALPDEQGLDILSSVYRFCEKRGYRPEGEAIRIGAWPKSGNNSGRSSLMTDPAELLRRQSAWQRERAQLSWGEKVRMAEEVREDVRKWARAGRDDSTAGPSSVCTPPSSG